MAGSKPCPTVGNAGVCVSAGDRAVPSNAVRRIVDRSGVDDLVAILADRLSGADLTTLLLEVARRRAKAITASAILQQHARDRFTQPSTVDARRLHAQIAAVLAALPDDIEVVELAPVAPLGAHSVIAAVHQDKVLSTIRRTEVAADPTNGLALEAATRRRTLMRRDPRSATDVRLAAVQRVVRAQRFDSPDAWSHFTLLGLVTAGRDRGSHRFEHEAVVSDIGALTQAMLRGGVHRVEIRVTDLSSGQFSAVDVLRTALDGDTRVTIAADPDREDGRGYYTTSCFKLFAHLDEQVVEIGDGGFVDWTQSLLANGKERLLISGLGIERLDAATTRHPTGP